MRSVVVALLAVWVLTGGCQRRAEQAASPTATADTLESIRQAFEQVDPRARVGRVVAVDAANRLAAVEDLDVEGIDPGEAVTFVGADRRVLTHGRVVRTVEQALHVRYEAPTATGRAPAEGDVAVITH